MTDALLALVRAHREAICTTCVEQMRADDRWQAASEQDLQRRLLPVLETLLRYWEQGDETEPRAWAQRQAHLAADAGPSCGEGIGVLDQVSAAICGVVETAMTERSELRAALSRVAQGVSCLRRCYLEAYERLMAQVMVQRQDYDNMRQQAHEWRALHDLSQQTGYTLRYDELVRHMLARIALAVPHDVSASILRTERFYDLFVRPTCPLDLTIQEDIQRRLLYGLSLMQDTVSEPKPEQLQIRALESEHFDAARPPLVHLYSSLQIPLIVGQTHEVVGLLFVGAEQRDAFTEAQVRLLYTMANQASLSIQRLRAILAESQQRLESLIEYLPDGVLLLDANRRLILANPMAQVSLAALTDSGMSDVLSYLGDRPMDELLSASTKAAHDELHAEGPPSQIFELDVRPLRVGPDTGGWILVIRDVTEERQSQKRVQQQERLAAVGQLAAGIAHDFNNLLTGIIGFADILQNKPRMADRERTMLGHIVTQGERGAHLVRQILDFSRLSISQLQPLDLAALLKDSLRFLERTIPENIRMILDVDAGEHLVHADAARLDQVLTNLVINARDAMPSGGELKLSLSRFTLKRHATPPCPDMPLGEWVLFSVADAGTGIAPDDLSRIYEPFFTTKMPGRGSGLGLAQVHGIVSSHDGYIRAESQVGVGTTIMIYLPLLPTRPSTLSDDVASEREVLPRASGETVLLVEDEPRVLEVCTLLLEELGYRVLTAADGQQGLDVYSRHQTTIDVVLMDMVMPGMGGVDLFKALQAMNPAVKAMMMTGYPLGEHGKQLLAQGILDWILKPLNVSRLAQIMRRALET